MNFVTDKYFTPMLDESNNIIFIRSEKKLFHNYLKILYIIYSRK